MTGPPIGYYVHHHGEGHRRRAVTIADRAPGRFTLIGTALSNLPARHARLELADDRIDADDRFAGVDHAGARPASLHYAPTGHDGVRARSAAIAAWIAESRPALMVVDVSVETAMLSRLCAVPTVYVRLAGDRSDPPHLDAFRGARALLAPFHAELDDPETPDWVLEKTRYFPGLAAAPVAGSPEDDVVLVAFGRGGGVADGEALAAAAQATPMLRWRAIGPVRPPQTRPSNLEILGWVEEPEREIARAGVVVGGAGDGLLGAVMAAGRPFVCLPEPRAFGEQDAKAKRLGVLGAALVLDRWPDAEAWPDVIAEALNSGGERLARLHDRDGPAKAAAFLTEAAAA